LLQRASAAGCDAAFVPHARRRTDVRLVAMDMDSTLITIECIDEIADLRGIKAEVALITASAMRGEIDFAQSLRLRVGLLEGLPESALQTVYDERLRISPGAHAMLAGFRAAGAKTLLASGGFTFFTQRLQHQLGIDYTVANTLEIVDGKLTGRVLGDIVDAQVKSDTLRRVRADIAHSQPGGIAIAIGDGANDLPMFAAADVSIAYRAKPVVRAQATHTLDHCGLDGALNLFNAGN
jgi:phosphoserine phosphatase